jgi:protease-4
MKINTDFLLERGYLKRQVSKWRILALVAVFLSVFFLSYFTTEVGKSSATDHVARIEISGVIEYDKEKLKKLNDILENKHIKAVILFVNSPGGTALGGETYYNIIKKIAQKITTVTVMGDFATSAAYMISLPSSTIIAHNATVTGSIGVFMQFPNLAEAAQKLGIKINMVKSGALKGEPNFFENPTPESLAVLQATINDFHSFFRKLVVENRKLEPKMVESIADGRIYTASQAKDLGLIDLIGTEETAENLIKEKLNKKDIQIIEYSLEAEKSVFEKILPKEKISSYFLNSLYSLNKLWLF